MPTCPECSFTPSPESDLALDGFEAPCGCCPTCHADHFVCDRCGSCPFTPTHYGIDFVTVGSDEALWCRECADMYASECCHCDILYPRRELTYCNGVVDGRVCPSCLERVRYCAECESAYWDDGEPTCDCADSQQPIHDYNYKPDPWFQGARKTEGRYYGLELEINTGKDLEDTAQHITDCCGGKVYCKHDGSIGRGYEIVSHPHTLPALRTTIEQIVRSLPSDATSYNSGKCGIHIHIERASLTQLTIGKMLVLLNCAENRTFVECIAQRDPTEWAKCKSSKKITSVREYRPDRYEALNINPPCTVELRIFRGNVRLDRILKCVEFAAALCDYCGQASLQDLGCKAFCAWVRKHRSEYKILDAYLVEKGYLVAWRAPKGDKNVSDRDK